MYSRFQMMCVLFAVAAGSVSASAQTQRPMEEMKGDCTNYGWNLGREFKLWDQSATKANASADINSAPAVPIDTKLDVALLPHSSVSFAATPEKDRGGPDKFSGLLTFTVPTAGLYRISASSGLWIDVVGGNSRVPSSAFEMQTQCRTVFKSVAYNLKAETVFTLQLSGSASASSVITITPYQP